MKNKQLKFHFNTWLWLNALWFLVGLFLLGWKPETVILAYVFETIVLGFFAVIKMLMANLWSNKQQVETGGIIKKSFSENELKTLRKWGGIRTLQILYGTFVLAMFAVVYFGFVWIQSIFVFLILSQNNPAISDAPNKLWENFNYLFLQPDFREALSGIIIFHIINFTRYFILEKQYLRTTLSQLFVQPWLRILVQQLLVIIGGFIFFSTDKNVVFVAALLVILKTCADSYFSEDLKPQK